jgi:hypothetical protein
MNNFLALHVLGSVLRRYFRLMILTEAIFLNLVNFD